MAVRGNDSWRAEKLEDICAQITDGKHGDCQDERNSGFYFLSCKDVSNGKLNYEGARQITKADFLDTHRRTKFEPSDVLITNSGTIGRMALAPNNELTHRTTFQKSVAILKPTASHVAPNFLYYALQSDIHRLIEFAGGTAQKNLLLRDLRGFEIRVPPLIEGFNNLCLNLSAIQDVLKSHYFVGKTLTAVGKTEWADIKWNDQSIADKKTIINGTDLVFISSATADGCIKAQKSLTDGGVNDRLLDCSDAHQFADSSDKDRLAKCFTWIKADPTFEGLRQAVFEYRSRVQISDVPPIEPVLQIKKVELKFSDEASLSRSDRSDVFCFRGTHEIAFSPYLTCIIGGRGTGKSTLLNLIHEKLDPGSTEFFKQNKLSPTGTSVDGGVRIDGISEQRVVEFLQHDLPPTRRTKIKLVGPSNKGE